MDLRLCAGLFVISVELPPPKVLTIDPINEEEGSAFLFEPARGFNARVEEVERTYWLRGVAVRDEGSGY